MMFLSNMLGSTIYLNEIDSSLFSLEDRWLGSYRTLPTGEAGWYRRLGLVDRVGLVATAHAITALGEVRNDVPHLNEAMRTLILHRRADGAWPFVSNLNDIGVIDSTAWVLVALYRWQDTAEFRELELPRLIQESLDWLERAALSEGGWGLTAEAPYRNYSTALAVEALCICGRRASSVVQRGINRMISQSDPVTGGWYDASRRLSLPSTCEVIRALSIASSDRSRFKAEISKACLWILRIARQTDFWSPTADTACLEEVEVIRNSQPTRIEYGHSTRPVAITALSLGGFASRPEVLAATKLLLSHITANRWQSIAGGHYSEPMSWMLYDVTTALVTFRKAFSSHTEALWYDNTRVVEHLMGQSFLIRTINQHGPKLIVGIACVIFAFMLNRAGMVQGFGWAMLLFILSTLTLNIVANLITESIKRGRD
jgi:hypothetical protein